VTESITIDAAPEAVYDLVADVARMGEWSPEAVGARGASVRPSPGDRFVGFNRRGPVIWWTYCTVLRAERGVVFEFDVDFGPIAVSRWTYTFEPSSQGTTNLVETWLDRRQGPLSLPIRAFGKLVIPEDRAEHNRATMRATLVRLKAAAEA
jgi:uncharacterized protein YndB with AHSA1/START domain